MSLEPPSEAEAQPLDRPIAIVGVGCRYADARGPREFWEIIRGGRNTVREVPEHRIELGYDIDYFYDPRPGIPGKVCSRLGGFLEHPELFDPAAYGLTPRDAVGMEPQQRLMVEVTWDALEDAGIVPERLHGERVAVILGFMAEDYSRQRAGCLDEQTVFRSFDVFTAAGMSHAVLSGRVSHLLGVTGPSLTLDTACSSSLYATHLACQSIQRGESDMAIAGGANIFLTPEGQIALSRSGMMSPTGQCRAFDAGANGFVRAEGAGVVVLRPLDDALAAGNPIYAVIRGSGVSSDGRGGGHMMAPSREGQAQAMRDAYRRSGIDPADVHYVETHGTGTVIGDPVEIGALADVMGPGRSPEEPLLVASVKGNLGHAESASGVAGLIKTALAIRHRELPAQLHFEQPSPAIAWDEIPIRVQAESTPWPRPGPALAGVNSFGISGTNAHVILESPPEPVGRAARRGELEGRAPEAIREQADEVERPCLITISAHEPQALEEMVEAHRDAARAGDYARLTDLAYTLGCRRSERPLRVDVVAASAAELADELDAYLDGGESGAIRVGTAQSGTKPELVMVFPGQGSQWLGMGRQLLARESVFAESIDRIGAAYAAEVEWSLREVLEGQADFDWRERLDVLQPVLVAVEVALAELWASWGIHPDRVVGQSMGEIAAAYVAGCLDLETMARLACQRGLVVARASGQGAMGVVALSSEDLSPELEAWDGRVEVAGISSPSTTIVAGDRDAVKGLVASLEARGTFARPLEVDFASHCFHMDPLLQDFRQRIGGLSPREGSIPFVSTVDGEERVGSELDVDYWVRNLRAAVSLPPAVEACLDAKASVFLEVSPHPSLSRAIEEIAGARELAIRCVGSLQREQDEQRSLLGSLADLHVAGVAVDFAALHCDGALVETPLYALQHRRYWFGDRNRSHSFRPTHPLLGPRRESSVDVRQSFWDVLLDLDAAPYLDDHRVDGRRVVPASLYLELGLAVCAETWPGEPSALEEVELRAPLQLPRDSRVALQLVLTREDDGGGSLRILSRDAGQEGGWKLRARARLGPATMGEGERRIEPLERESLEPLPSADLCERLESQGLAFGRRFQTFKELGLEGGENDTPSLLAHLMLPRVSESEWHAYLAHPALLAGALQLLGETCEPARALRSVSIDSLQLDSALGSECWVRVRARKPLGGQASRDEILVGDVDVFDREGRVLGRIEGLRGRPLASARGAQRARGSELHRVEWRPVDLERTVDARQVRRWILIADAESEAQSLAVELEKRRGRCFFCEKVEDFAELAARLRRESSEPWGLVLLGWADRSDPERQEPESHRSFRIASWSEAIREEGADAAEVWIASRGLQRVLASDPLPGRGAAALAADVDGFASLSELEQCRFFDASASLEHRERVRLSEVMGAGLPERQLAARDETLFGVRLRRAPQPGEGVLGGRSRKPAGERLFRAALGASEGVGEIVFRESASAAWLPEHAVEVEVRAASLSALDVMSSLGLSRGEIEVASGLGRDFAGIVTDCGPGVTGVRVGDRVMGLAEGAVARRVVVPSSQLALLPPGLDFVEGASLPLPYAVAALALEELSTVRRGQRVLIRSAAGGVGLAAISIARSHGAEVFATAGDESRRALIRQWGAVVLDARASGGIDASTQGAAEGFDVIVAAEGEALIHDSLDRLRPGGRYVDLSPRREFELGEVGSLCLDANRAYSALDLRAFIESDPGRIGDVLRRTSEAVRAGGWKTLPTTVFPISEAGRALRFMAQNRHAGRVTLDFDQAERVEIVPLDEVPTWPEKEGTWVVAGAPGPMREPIVEWLRRRGGTSVRRVATADLGDAIAELASEGTALRGLVYVDSVANPLGDVLPKEIARLTGHELDLVALISLRETADGPQAARREWETRTWLDRLLVATLEGRATHAFGLAVSDDVTPTQLHRMLDEAIASRDDAAIQVSIGAAERAARRASSDTPLFDELEVEEEGPRRTGRLREALCVLGGGERRRAMDRFVGDALATVLSLGEREREALDLARPLDQLGLDSLMMMELFMGISRELELEIARDWFPSAPSAADVSAVLLEQLEQTARHGGA